MYQLLFVQIVSNDNILWYTPFFFVIFFLNRRTDLRIRRELDKTKEKANRTLKCDVMMIGGATSPHINDTVSEINQL